MVPRDKIGLCKATIGSLMSWLYSFDFPIASLKSKWGEVAFIFAFVVRPALNLFTVRNITTNSK